MNQQYDDREFLKSIRMRETHLEREGEYWTDEEREKLENLYNAGVGISEIAIELKRTEQAIMAQINLYLGRQSDTFGVYRQKKQRKCKCLCSKCKIGIENCPYRANHTEEEAMELCSTNTQI